MGQFLAELGADVIKVENIKSLGDVTRSWKSAGEKTDDRSAYFCSVNWGKRSIALDLTKPEGQDIVQKLASQSEIIIASYKPGDAEKLGVDYKTLSSENPGLIYGMVTGYGVSNPRVGYDAITQAEAGFMFMNGEPGGPSLKMPVALIDILAGHHLKEGLLLALLDKNSTQKGKLVHVSLIQVAVSSLANQASNWLVGGKLPRKQGSSHPNIAPYGDVFKTLDGKEILLAIGNDRQFMDLCKVLSITSVGLDDRFKDNPSRVLNREQLRPILDLYISQINSSDLITKINQAKIPAGLIQNIQQVFEMPEAKELLFEWGGLKGVKTSLSESNSANSSHFLPPPRLGEHSEIILSESLNFSPQAIKSLRSQGILG